MRKKKIALKLLRWFIESGLACFMIIALITLLFGEELHWRKACVNAIVLAVLITLLRVKGNRGLFQSAKAEKARVGGCVSRGK